jgi:hypothetical protein
VSVEDNQRMARCLVWFTPALACKWYLRGYIGVDLYVAFLYHWVGRGHRYGPAGVFTTPPIDPNVISLVALLHRCFQEINGETL